MRVKFAKTTGLFLWLWIEVSASTFGTSKAENTSTSFVVTLLVTKVTYIPRF